MVGTKIINWIKNNKLESFWVIMLVLLSLFLRFYKIDQYMTFLGDEGRDAIVVKGILVDKHLPLLGPPTSVGNIYLGPLYYYMMAIAMGVSWLNPAAAAVMVGIIGCLTVLLVYYLARVWFGKLAALLGSVLYSISPVTIIYSRSSWNPNPAPFFALLSFLGIYLSRKTTNFYFFLLTGIGIAFAIQMHYLALILIPTFILLWIFELIQLRKGEVRRKNFWRGTAFSILIFLFFISPLVIFDLRHNFVNFKAISAFFFNRETTVNLNPFNTLARIVPILNHDLVGRYISAENSFFSLAVSVLMLTPLGYGIWTGWKSKQVSWEILALGVWLVFGIMGLALYKQTIFDHYLGFLNPVPYLLLGGVIPLVNKLKQHLIKQTFLAFLMILFIALIFLNLEIVPLLNPPNKQLQRTQEIAKFVIAESNNKPFNFALIAEHNYDSAYQYYLDIYNHKPKMLPFNITDQLFVVCEDIICNPINHPKYEIAAFGWAEIVAEKGIYGVRIYKLAHNIPNKLKK